MSAETTGGPIPSEGFPSDVEAMHRLAEHLTETVSKAETDMGWEDTVKVLAVLRDVKWLLGVVDTSLVRHVYLNGEHGKQLIDGVGQVQVSRSRDRREWDGPAVARAVIDAKMQDSDGTMPDPMDVAEWLLAVFPADRVRVTPLRELGIDPVEHDMCVDTPGRPAVSIPSARR